MRNCSARLQEFQRLVRGVREQIKSETDQALKQEEARYKIDDALAWGRTEEYYKALTESLYLHGARTDRKHYFAGV